MASSTVKRQADLQWMSAYTYSLSLPNNPTNVSRKRYFSWGCFKRKKEHSMKCSWKCLLWKLRLKLFWVFHFRWHIAGWLCHWLMLSVSQDPFLLYELWFLDEPGVHKSDISESKYFQVFIKSSKSAIGKSNIFLNIFMTFSWGKEQIFRQLKSVNWEVRHTLGCETRISLWRWLFQCSHGHKVKKLTLTAL